MNEFVVSILHDIFTPLVVDSLKVFLFKCFKSRFRANEVYNMGFLHGFVSGFLVIWKGLLLNN